MLDNFLGGNYMKTKKIAYGVGLAVMFCFAGSQAYAFQAEAGFQNDSTDIDSNNDLSVMSVGGTYYLKPVDVSGPQREAAFLAKASGVNAHYGTVDATVASTGLSGNAYGLGVDYLLPMHDIKVGVGIQSYDVSASGTTFKQSMTTLGVGKYLDDRKYVAFSYGTGTDSVTGFPDTDNTDINVNGKWLLEQNGKTINLEGSIARASSDDGITSGSNNIIKVGGDYYWDNSLSVGMGYSTNSGDNTSDEGSTIDLQAEKYVTEAMSVAMVYSKFSADSASDETTISFTIGGRF